MGLIRSLVLLLLSLASLAFAEPNPDRVALLVYRDTYSQLRGEIERYRTDVEERFRVKLEIYPGGWSTPAQVRAAVRRLHETRGTSGVVLVGNLPMHRFHMHDFDNPNPLYYEDFDLEFVDRDGNGVDDAYRGTPRLKVWVANLRAAEKADDPGIDSLRAFFDNTHAYYTGKTRIRQRAFGITDTDWPDGANLFAKNVGNVLFGPNGTDTLSCKEATLDNLRKAFETGNYALFTLQVHSTETRQDMNVGQLHSKEILEIPTGALFTVNNGCSNCNWLKAAHHGSERNTGMSWVFGKGVGQAVVGNVRTGMVYGQEALYDRILAGDYLGRAYLACKQAGEDEMHREYPSGDIVAGVLFIGNPFLAFREVSAR